MGSKEYNEQQEALAKTLVDWEATQTDVGRAVANSTADVMAMRAVDNGPGGRGVDSDSVSSDEWATSLVEDYLQRLPAEAQARYQARLATTLESLRRGNVTSPAKAQWAATTADPVEHYRGEFVHEATDLVVRGAGLDFAFHRTYRHQAVGHGPLGHRWSHGYHMSLVVNEIDATLITGTGRHESYMRHLRWPTDDFAYYLPPDGVDATLEPLGPAAAPVGWIRRSPDGLRHVFEPEPGWSGGFRLARIEDRWGNYLAFTYVTRPSGLAVIDRCQVNHAHRWVQFAYDEFDHVTRLQDHAGRTWRYRYDAHGDLIGVTTPGTPDQPRGATTGYRYTSSEWTGELAHLLTDIFDADGRHYLRTEYGTAVGEADYNRVIRQRVGTGDYWFRYQPVVDQDLGLAVEDRPTMECWVKERNGTDTQYVYNGWGALLWKQEPDAGPGHAPRRVQWRFRYNRDGALTASRTPEGRVTHLLTGRDHFLRVNNLAPESPDADRLWAHDKLTAEIRRGFGRVLATVERAAPHVATTFPWNDRWGDVYAIQPGDIVVKRTYELEFGQLLTVSDPRVTTASDPESSEPALVTRYVYALNATRDLIRIEAPTPTLPDGTPGGPVVTEVLGRDTRGRVTRARDAVGTETTTEYVVDPTGNDPREGFPWRTVVDPGGLALTTVHELDVLGRVTRTWLPRAVGAAPGEFAVEQDYDALDRVVAARRATPLATETRTHYEPAGMPKEVQVDWIGPVQPAGIVARRFYYDEEHHLRKETFGSADHRDHHRIAHAYNAAGLRTVTIAANDRSTLWKYDSRDQVAKVIRGAGVGESIEVIVRDRDGREIEHRSPEGRTARTTYDAFGRVVAVTDPVGTVTRTSYDAGGRPTVVRVFERDAAASPPSFTLLSRAATVYDQLGRAVTTTVSRFAVPPPAVGEGDLSTAYEAAVVGVAVSAHTFYDAAGRVVRVVDPLGNAATTEYDAAGRPWRVADPTGNQVVTTFDAHGNAVRVDRIDQVHDVAGAVIGQEVFTTTAEFDARDRKVRQVDALGNATVFEYDSLDRLVRTTDPLGNVVERTFDVYGNQLEVRTLRTSTGDGTGGPLDAHIARNEYDPAGFPLARIDALGRRTEYRRDKWDRVIEEVLPDGARIVTQYDRDSLVTAVRDAHGVVVRTQHDVAGRPTRTLVDTAEVDAGVTIEGVTQVDRAYDGLGRLRLATNAVAVIALGYDSLGRTVSEQTTVTATGQQVALARAYDDAGRLTGLTYPGGRQLAYAHDGAGRVRTIQHQGDGAGYPGAAGVPRTVAAYAYAGARPRTVTYANGASTAYTHDARGGVIEVHHTGPAGTLLRVQQLRDGARAPRARVEDAGAGLRDERFGYDSRYQLGVRVAATGAGLFNLAPFLPATAVPSTAPPPRQTLIDAAIGPRLGPDASTGADAWVHDLVGNRERTRADDVETSYGTVDNRDRYASVAADGYAYDRAGNLLSDGRFNYVYDGLRRLVRIVQVTTGTTVARYDYDPAGRRVVEERPGAPAVVIAYDGVGRIADYRDGACVGQYVHGPGVDDPVELAAGGATHAYHLDLQGSVRVLSRADGTAAAMYSYDPFGVLRPSSGPLLAPPGAPGATSATQPFGYAARPFEAATATYDARARCYVPALGRFLQRDPAGAVDGHLYAYAGNHPLAFGDPSGLARRESAHPSGDGAPPGFYEAGIWPRFRNDSISNLVDRHGFNGAGNATGAFVEDNGPAAIAAVADAKAGFDDAARDRAKSVLKCLGPTGSVRCVQTPRESAEAMVGVARLGQAMITDPASTFRALLCGERSCAYGVGKVGYYAVETAALAGLGSAVEAELAASRLAAMSDAASTGNIARGVPTRLNLGSGRNPMAGAVNLDIQARNGVDVVADAARLPFRSGAFDEVHAINPYGYQPVSAETARVLKPGGRLFVTGTPRNMFAQAVAPEVAEAQGLTVVGQCKMIPEHVFGVQSTTSGAALKTWSSSTTIYGKIAP